MSTLCSMHKSVVVDDYFGDDVFSQSKTHAADVDPRFGVLIAPVSYIDAVLNQASDAQAAVALASLKAMLARCENPASAGVPAVACAPAEECSSSSASNAASVEASGATGCTPASVMNASTTVVVDSNALSHDNDSLASVDEFNRDAPFRWPLCRLPRVMWRHKAFFLVLQPAVRVRRVLNRNAHLTESLNALLEDYGMGAQYNDEWRTRNMKRAVAFFQRLPFTLRTVHQFRTLLDTMGKTLVNVFGLGPKTRLKVAGMLTDGLMPATLRGRMTNAQHLAAKEMTKIWGVGTVKGMQLVSGQQAATSIPHLRALLAAGTPPLYKDAPILSEDSVRVLPYVEELMQRIPRAEVEEIIAYVRSVAILTLGHAAGGVEVMCCGSYRRGKPSSGDVDILIAPIERCGVCLDLAPLLTELRRRAFLIEDLRVPHFGEGGAKKAQQRQLQLERVQATGAIARQANSKCVGTRGGAYHRPSGQKAEMDGACTLGEAQPDTQEEAEQARFRMLARCTAADEAAMTAFALARAPMETEADDGCPVDWSPGYEFDTDSLCPELAARVTAAAAAAAAAAEAAAAATSASLASGRKRRHAGCEGGDEGGAAVRATRRRRRRSTGSGGIAGAGEAEEEEEEGGDEWEGGAKDSASSSSLADEPPHDMVADMFVADLERSGGVAVSVPVSASSKGDGGRKRNPHDLKEYFIAAEEQALAARVNPINQRAARPRRDRPPPLACRDAARKRPFQFWFPGMVEDAGDSDSEKGPCGRGAGGRLLGKGKGALPVYSWQDVCAMRQAAAPAAAAADLAPVVGPELAAAPSAALLSSSSSASSRGGGAAPSASFGGGGRGPCPAAVDRGLTQLRAAPGQGGVSMMSGTTEAPGGGAARSGGAGGSSERLIFDPAPPQWRFLPKKDYPTATYMGLCRLPPPAPAAAADDSVAAPGAPSPLPRRLVRRIDIKSYPREYLPYATLYFTGSDYFNRSMRAYVNCCGWTLSDQGLRRATRGHDRSRTSEGHPVDCCTEADVFAAIGLPYRTPQQRETDVAEVVEYDGGPPPEIQLVRKADVPAAAAVHDDSESDADSDSEEAA